MTPQDIITDARYILNDTDPVSPRASDTELLLYVNDGIKESAPLQPMWFATVGDLICTTNQCEQAVTFDDAIGLIEVLCIHGSTALTPFDFIAMNAFNPNWRSDTPGPARQWSKFANDPLRFYVYPAAPATAQTLDVRYIRNPATYALTDPIAEMPDAMKPALADYVVYRASSKDDEHVLSQRAQSFYQSFAAKIKGG